MSAGMKTTALAPWGGSDRMSAERIAGLIGRPAWLGVPFAGGMSVLAHVNCRSIVVNDLHRHVVNLAIRVAKDKTRLVEMLSAMPFHPDVLAGAQNMCSAIEAGVQTEGDGLHWAASYFVCCWMGRSGMAGTDSEFNGSLSTRWTSSGGDSNKRYRSAIESLGSWEPIMQKCSFSTIDFREFNANVKNNPKHCVYVDAPWPDADVSYKHRFTETDQRDLRDSLLRFDAAKIVVRYGDHPLIRELYPEPKWKWHSYANRNQGNNAITEVLITRNER